MQGSLIFPMMTHGELGVCLPSMCTSSDVQNIVQAAIKRASETTMVDAEVSFFDHCIDSDSLQPGPYTQTDYCAIILFAVAIVFIAIASLLFTSSSSPDGNIILRF